MKNNKDSRYLMKTKSTPLISRRSFLEKTTKTVAALSLGTLFGQSVLAQPEAGRPEPWKTNFELAIAFSVVAPESRRYKKPYVAVWVENTDGEIVKTLSLWLMQKRPGPRWYPDLKRWYTREENRKEAYGGDMIEFLSTPTRSPGSYNIYWDGTNDVDQLVVQDDYFICIESAREHGPYNLIREAVTIADTPFIVKVEDKSDLGGVSFDYRKRIVQEES